MDCTDNIIAWIAQAAGQTHDLGKNVCHFQTRLWQAVAKGPKDPVRHEWLSVMTLVQLRQGQSLEQAFANACALLDKPPKLERQQPGWLKTGMLGPQDAVEAIVANRQRIVAYVRLRRGMAL